MISKKLEELLREIQEISYDIDIEVMHTGNRDIIRDDMLEVLKLSTSIIIEVTELLSKIDNRS